MGVQGGWRERGTEPSESLLKLNFASLGESDKLDHIKHTFHVHLLFTWAMRWPSPFSLRQCTSPQRQPSPLWDHFRLTPSLLYSIWQCPRDQRTCTDGKLQAPAWLRAQGRTLALLSRGNLYLIKRGSTCSLFIWHQHDFPPLPFSTPF